MGKTILITGGARSGKSDFAQELALKNGNKVYFVATAVPCDEEMKERIMRHKQARPHDWITLEIPSGVANKLNEYITEADSIVLDCLTILVNNVMYYHSTETQESVFKIETAVEEEIEALINYFASFRGTFIVVTNEVGLGLVPENAYSRLYRDLLGRANQKIARQADEVYLMVAGIPVRIK